MAVKHTSWPTKPTPKKEEVVVVPAKPKKIKKAVKKEIVIKESTPIVEEEMTIEDVLTALEKKSQ